VGPVSSRQPGRTATDGDQIMADPSVQFPLPEHHLLLGQALADAVYYRDPPLQCSACEITGDLCTACADGLALARSYLALGHQLGLAEPR
jgi:hypothetical protein